MRRRYLKEARVTALRRATRSPVLYAWAASGGGVDFVTADDRHGWHHPATATTHFRPGDHHGFCGPLFHRSVPNGWWRIKTLLEPGMVTFESLRHTRAVLAEAATDRGWVPYGQLHTHWAGLLSEPYVVAELAVTNTAGQRFAGDEHPLRAGQHR